MAKRVPFRTGKQGRFYPSPALKRDDNASQLLSQCEGGCKPLLKPHLLLGSSNETLTPCYFDNLYLYLYCRQLRQSKWWSTQCIIPSANSSASSIMLYSIWFLIGVIGRSSAENRRGELCTAKRICSLADAGEDIATTVFCASSSLSDNSSDVERLTLTTHTLTTEYDNRWCARGQHFQVKANIKPGHFEVKARRFQGQSQGQHKSSHS